MALEKKAEKDKKEKKNFLALAAKEYKYEGILLLVLALIGISVGFVLCSTIVHYIRKFKFLKILSNKKDEK